LLDEPDTEFALLVQEFDADIKDLINGLAPYHDSLKTNLRIDNGKVNDDEGLYTNGIGCTETQSAIADIIQIPENPGIRSLNTVRYGDVRWMTYVFSHGLIL
jgi:hypothetical protein